VAPRTAGHLTGAHGEADEGDVVQVEVIDERFEIVGEGAGSAASCLSHERASSGYPWINTTGRPDPWSST
jgi:hypothetical protein